MRDQEVSVLDLFNVPKKAYVRLYRPAHNGWRIYGERALAFQKVGDLPILFLTASPGFAFCPTSCVVSDGKAIFHFGLSKQIDYISFP